MRQEVAFVNSTNELIHFPSRLPCITYGTLRDKKYVDKYVEYMSIRNRSIQISPAAELEAVFDLLAVERR